MSMLEERILLLNAKFDELSKRLLTVTATADRAALLDEMRAILEEIDVLAKAAGCEPSE